LTKIDSKADLFLEGKVMSRILMVYGTTEGHTRKIAGAIFDELESLGHTIDVYEAGDLPEHIRPENYDAVMAGGSVHGSHFSKELRNWISLNAKALSDKPGAFFSVCLGVLQTSNSAIQEAEKNIVEHFFQETEWYPKTWTIFAGALLYTQYGWFKRQVMRVIASRAGGDTDTSRDYEYTNWEAVRFFAQDFSSKVLRGLESAS